jgi:hypothetical protein
MVDFTRHKQGIYAANTRIAKMYRAIFGDEPEIYTIVKQKHVDPGEYHYFATFVVSLGVLATTTGQTRVGRIWADGELIYDIANGVHKTGLKFTFFDGNENQGEVYRGMHYRGQATVRFEDLDLDDFGGAVPAMAVELIDVVAADEAALRTSIASDFSSAVAMQLDPASALIFKLGIVTGDLTQSKRVALGTGIDTLNTPIPDSGYMTPGNWASVVWFNQLGAVFATGSPANDPQTVSLYRLTPSEAETITVFTEAATESDGLTFGRTEVATGFVLRTGSLNQNYVLGFGEEAYVYAHVYRVDVDRLSRAIGIGEAVGLAATPAIVAGPAIDGQTTLYVYQGETILRYVIRPSTQAGVELTADVDTFYTAATGEVIRKVNYDQANDRLIVFVQEVGSTTHGVVLALDNTGATVWTSAQIELPADKGVNAHTSEGSSSTSGNVLVVTKGAQTDELTRIDLTDGDTATIALSFDVDPDAMAIWHGQANRLYLPTLHYVQFGVPVAPGELTLDRIVRDFGAIVGYEDADITTVNMDLITAKGFIVSSDETYREFLNGLGQLYGFNWLNDADHITVKYPYDEDGALVIDYVIDADRMGYITGGDTDNVKLQFDLGDDSEIPSKVLLTYFDANNEYKSNTQVIGRSVAPMDTNVSQSEASIVAALTASNAEAQALLYSMLSSLWEGKSTYNYRIGSDGLAILPIDVVQFTVNSTVYEALVRSLRINADFSVTVSASSIAGAAYPATVAPQDTGQARNIYNPARAVLLDIPDIYPAWTSDNSYNIVALVGGYVQGAFTGASLEVDSAEGWQDLVSVDASQEGYIATALAVPPVWAYPFEMDTVNEIVIRQDNVPDSLLVSVSDIELGTGANLVALVFGGKAELIQFKDVEETSPGVWRLYNLLRGRYGTEVYMGMASAGAPVAFMRNVQLVPYNEADFGLELVLDYRARSPRQSVLELAVNQIAPTGDSRRPYAPVEVIATREGDGDLLLSWQRRARYTNTPYSDINSPPPLDEETEAYRLEFYLDAGFTFLAGTYDTTAPAYLYTQTDQVVDGFSADETTAYVRIYQLTAEAVELGFSWSHAVPVYPPDTHRLAATFRGGGELVGNVELTLAGAIGASFELGGSLIADVAESTALRASFALGGALSANIREPVTLSASFDGGGALVGSIGGTVALGAIFSGGGTLTADIAEPPTIGAHRYWRIYMMQNAIAGGSTDAFSIAEIEVFDQTNTEVTPAGSAMSASVTFSSPTYAADKTVDGNTSTFWSGTATFNSRHDWLQIDFGSGVEHEIRKLRMYPRSDLLGQNPTSFLVEYSDNGSSWTTAETMSTTWPSAAWQEWTW